MASMNSDGSQEPIEQDVNLQPLNASEIITHIINYLHKNHHIWQKYHPSFTTWLASIHGHNVLQSYWDQFSNWIMTTPDATMSEDTFEFIESIFSHHETLITYARTLNQYSSLWIVLQRSVRDFPHDNNNNNSQTEKLSTLLEKKLTNSSPELIAASIANILPFLPLQSTDSQQHSDELHPSLLLSTQSLSNLSNILPAGILPHHLIRFTVFKGLFTSSSSSSTVFTTPIPLDDDQVYKEIEIVITGALIDCQKVFLQQLFSSPLAVYAYENYMYILRHLLHTFFPHFIDSLFSSKTELSQRLAIISSFLTPNLPSHPLFCSLTDLPSLLDESSQSLPDSKSGRQSLLESSITFYLPIISALASTPFKHIFQDCHALSSQLGQNSTTTTTQQQQLSQTLLDNTELDVEHSLDIDSTSNHVVIAHISSLLFTLDILTQWLEESSMLSRLFLEATASPSSSPSSQPSTKHLNDTTLYNVNTVISQKVLQFSQSKLALNAPSLHTTPEYSAAAPFHSLVTRCSKASQPFTFPQLNLPKAEILGAQGAYIWSHIRMFAFLDQPAQALSIKAQLPPLSPLASALPFETSMGGISPPTEKQIVSLSQYQTRFSTLQNSLKQYAMKLPTTQHILSSNSRSLTANALFQTVAGVTSYFYSIHAYSNLTICYLLSLQTGCNEGSSPPASSMSIYSILSSICQLGLPLILHAAHPLFYFTTHFAFLLQSKYQTSHPSTLLSPPPRLPTSVGSYGTLALCDWFQSQGYRTQDTPLSLVMFQLSTLAFHTHLTANLSFTPEHHALLQKSLGKLSTYCSDALFLHGLVFPTREFALKQQQ